MIFIGILLVLNFILSARFQLAIFQQEHYNPRTYIKRYKKYLLSHSSLFIISSFIFVCLGKNWYYAMVAFVLIGGAIAFQQKLKVPLKYTARIIRLITTVLLLVFWFVFLPMPLLVILTLAIPLLLIIGYLINKPLEKMIAQRFLDKAKAILDSYEGTIIGITGSYGKTSVKNFITSLLKTKYTVLPSPKSYNTPLGIARTINEYYRYEEYLVLEFGARFPKDILELSQLVNPQIAIITEIGPQHLSTFGSIEMIQKTKSEILESSRLKIAVLYYDNELIRELKIPTDCRLVTYGLKHGEYQARNISLVADGTSFDVYQNDDFLVHITTSLLGLHNVSNLLCAITVGIISGIDVEVLAYKISQQKPVEHRLEVKSYHNVLIIDDSFNSNFVGFINALDCLALSNHYKVLITPGIVESVVDSEYKKLAERIKEVADRVCLIDSPSGQLLGKYLQAINCSFQFYRSFNGAYTNIIKSYTDTMVTLLIENDLPDNYL